MKPACISLLIICLVSSYNSFAILEEAGTAFRNMGHSGYHDSMNGYIDNEKKTNKFFQKSIDSEIKLFSKIGELFYILHLDTAWGLIISTIPDFEKFKEFFQKESNWNLKDPGTGWRPLHIAAMNKKHIKKLEFLSQIFAENNLLQAKDREGRTALRLAIMMGNFEATKHLLETLSKNKQGYNLNKNKSYKGRTLLHEAIQTGSGTHDEILQSLYMVASKEGKNNMEIQINVMNKMREKYFEIDYMKYRFKFVKLLIKYGGDVNAKDANGWTPLHYLASKLDSQPNKNAVKLFNLLKKEGAKFDIANNKGMTVFDLVSKLQPEDTIFQLFKKEHLKTENQKTKTTPVIQKPIHQKFLPQINKIQNKCAGLFQRI